ncbi:MAG: hypothetical protein J0L97_05440 [Alphaproteobacteria bacterium]|nr:hypothetical protein [Alphaproteobacteria bacterium]
MPMTNKETHAGDRTVLWTALLVLLIAALAYAGYTMYRANNYAAPQADRTAVEPIR